MLDFLLCNSIVMTYDVFDSFYSILTKTVCQETFKSYNNTEYSVLQLTSSMHYLDAERTTTTNLQYMQGVPKKKKKTIKMYC
jgi:hypothetical protein